MPELWRPGIKWDEALPSGLQMKWTELVSDFEKITHVKIPRQCFSSSSTRPGDAEIHMFVDTSTKGLYNCCLFEIVTRTSIFLCDGKISHSTNKRTDSPSAETNRSHDRYSTCLLPPSSTEFCLVRRATLAFTGSAAQTNSNHLFPIGFEESRN